MPVALTEPNNLRRKLKMFEIRHPEKWDDEILLGNVELDQEEKEDFGHVKQRLGLETLRRGLTAYNENGKKMSQCNGICDIYGPYPLFIQKTEFGHLQEKNPRLTPDKLFRKIIKNMAHKGRVHDYTTCR